jgi:hypothetical protein
MQSIAKPNQKVATQNRKIKLYTILGAEPWNMIFLWTDSKPENDNFRLHN